MSGTFAAGTENFYQQYGRISNEGTYTPRKGWGEDNVPEDEDLGMCGLETPVRSMSYAASFTPGDIVGIVRSAAQAMAENMADGNSVKIDGIGVFTPSLGLRKGVKRESGVEDEPRRNAASICVDSIRFRRTRIAARNGQALPTAPLVSALATLIEAIHAGRAVGLGETISGEPPLYARGRLYGSHRVAPQCRRQRAEAVGGNRTQRNRVQRKKHAQGVYQGSPIE